MPGGKITMLPPEVIERYTLTEGQECPALSMYLTVAEDDFRVISTESTLERIHISANLRHETLQVLFNEEAIAKGNQDYPYKDELILLWKLANVLESARGKADKFPQQMEYNISLQDDRVVIVPRMRGTPIDKVVSELMIYVNSEWGRHLADHSIAAIYRTQNAGKVVMSCEPGSHQGLGVDQYAWSSSPLRRYIDLVNQRQLVAWLQGEIPPYANDDDALLATIRDFEAAYEMYGEFQRNMERYWCLRYLLQEAVVQTEGTVIREGLVRLAKLPLVTRVPLLPDYSPGTEVALEVLHVDVWELALNCRCKGRVKAPDSLPV